jgi:localization factor PodJL
MTETPETAPDTELQASLDALPAGAAPIALVEAARDGDPRAFFELGARHAEGRGVAVDEEAAARWYREAAERGLAPAQYRLATATEKGIGVERDLDAARRLYEEAAEAGNVRAMHNLAVLHASGVTGEPNYKLAAEWFERAAEHGVADSQFNIAVLYARGSGVEQDLAQSYKWFAIAAEGGDTGAEAKRDEVAEAMDAAALEAARAEVEAWKPQPADEDANEVVLPEEWGIDTTESASTDPARTISSVQRILNAQGFDAGTPDGILGENTVAAIRAFQEAEGLDVTGQIDGELVQALIKSERRG